MLPSVGCLRRAGSPTLHPGCASGGRATRPGPGGSGIPEPGGYPSHTGRQPDRACPGKGPCPRILDTGFALNDSARALSAELPTLLIDCLTPAASQTAAKALDVYWAPWSEWKIAPSRLEVQGHPPPVERQCHQPHRDRADEEDRAGEHDEGPVRDGEDAQRESHGRDRINAASLSISAPGTRRDSPEGWKPHPCA